MKQEKLFEFYEKIYFHEMQNRDTLYSRVQINFALLFTGFSIISYMLRMLDFSVYRNVSILFVILGIISVVISAHGVTYLIKAFWGNEYKGVPSPRETDKYRIQVEEYAESINEYNREYPNNRQEPVDVEEMVSTFLYDQLRDCSSHNTEVNDVRFAHIHNSVRWLLIAAVPFLIASVLFITYDLDASSPRKETLIYNKSLVENLKTIDSNLVQASYSNKELLKVQQICQINQNQALHLLHQVLQQRLVQDELLKTVNHLKKCEDYMSDKKPPPPPPQAPARPIARVFNDEALPKSSK